MKKPFNGLLPGGSLKEGRNVLSGKYKDYIVVMFIQENMYHITINAHSDKDTNNIALKAFADKLCYDNRYILSVENKQYSLALIIKAPSIKKKIPALINGIVDEIVNYLAENNYSTGCEMCGGIEENLALYKVNSSYKSLCNKCSGEVQETLRNNRDKAMAKKSNFSAGLVGAFLGTLIGGILWVLIYKLGYIAGLAGAITVICALKGYELLGKELDLKGAIAAIIISLLMIYFANKVAWALSAYDAFKKYYDVTFFDVFKSIDELMVQGDLTFSYGKDLLIGYILTFICSIRSIIYAIKNSRGSYSFKKFW